MKALSRVSARQCWDDSRYAVLSILRRPWASLFIVLSLALAIGLNVVLFSFVQALVLSPPPGVLDPQSLVSLSQRTQGVPHPLPVSYPNYLDISRQSSSLAGLAAYRPVSVGLTLPGGTELVAATVVSPTFFETLQVRAARGRLWPRDEVGASDSVVVSERFWREHLGGVDDIAGAKILLNNRPYSVVGVAGGRFKGLQPASTTQIWLPVSALPNVCDCSLAQLEDRSDQSFMLVGRLLPGKTSAALRSDLALVGSRLAQVYPESNRDLILQANPLLATLGKRLGSLKIGVVLLGTFVLLLGMVCANISSVLLARVLMRQRDLEVALCIGARPGRLFRQLFLECLFLCLAGGVGSLLVFLWSYGLMAKLAFPLLDPAAVDASLNPATAALFLVLALATAVVISIFPVRNMARIEAVGLMRGEPSAAARRHRLSSLHVLVMVQTAVSALAFTAASFALENLKASLSVDLGFQAGDVLTVAFDLQPLGIAESEGRQLQAELVRRIERLPHVRSVSFAERPPLGGFREWLPARNLGQGEVYLEQGLEDLQRAGLSDAEFHFQSVFNRNGLAMIRHFQGRFKEALDLCREGYAEMEAYLNAESHKLHRSVLLFNLAQVYSTLGEQDEAIRHYSAAIEMDPNYSEYYNDRGSTYLRLGRLEEALADYSRAIELSPPYAEVYVNLGQCYRSLGDMARAVEAFDVAIDLDPSRILAFAARGQCLEAQGHISEAIGDYGRALELDPEQWDVLASLAVLHYECGRLDDALADLSSAIHLAPKMADLYQNRAIALTDLGRLAEAARDLSVYLELTTEGEDRKAAEARLKGLEAMQVEVA